MIKCYMAPPEDDDDPAVYKSNTVKKAHRAKDADGMEEDGDSADEDEDDGPLLVSRPGFNRMTLALRDEGVLRFVKYVSGIAKSSRWDVCGEWQVGAVEEDSGDE